jgi:hypothetical protein
VYGSYRYIEWLLRAFFYEVPALITLAQVGLAVEKARAPVVRNSSFSKKWKGSKPS